MKSICVYCGSSAGSQPLYGDAASALAAQLVGKGLGLVYGGGNVGLMGMIAD
ncbi:MAG: TIGR00730 family Rossman fold protein, partial [Janthinobacterium lividum]